MRTAAGLSAAVRKSTENSTAFSSATTYRSPTTHSFQKGGVMNLVKWSPFREIEDMQTRLNRLFTETMPRRVEPDGVFFADWAPPVDVQETATEYLIKAELPEIKKEDVKVEMLDGVLTIEGE